jgi:hypothetical protein
MATPTFPRLLGARPRLASMPRFTSGIQAWSQSGKGQLRAIQNMGRVWRETYPLLDLSNPNVRTLVQAINQALREGTVWNVQHPYWHSRKGIGGGSALVNSPSQLVSVPENFIDTAWTIRAGTPTLLAGQSDPFGGTGAYLITDDDVATSEGIQIAVVFTGDGTKAIAIYAKPNVGVTSFQLVDDTAATSRILGNITWSVGVPSVAMTAGVLLLAEAIPNSGGWYRFHCQGAGVVAANNNRITLRIDAASAANTGSSYYFGVNAWNSVTPAAYRGQTVPGPSNNPTGQVGSFLYIRGGPASTSAWLKQGDLIQVTDAAVVLDVTGQVDTNSAGGAIIPVYPPIFEGHSPLDGAVVEVNPANIFFRAIITDVQDLPDIDSTTYVNAGMALTWRELPQ